MYDLTRVIPGPDPDFDPQSAAINEGFGDVSAIIVDAHHRPSIVPATWVIGEVFLSDPNKGLRSAANPKSMNASSNDWYPTRSTLPFESSSHVNSTIMSHAFKLLSTGGYHARSGQPIGGGASGNIPSLFVTALGRAKAAQIFYGTMLREDMDNTPNFVIMKAAAESVASTLYGEFERDAVSRAFRAVGVTDSCSLPPPPPVLNAENYFCKGMYSLWWNPVPGATKYYGQKKLGGWPWANSVPFVEGNILSCEQQVSQVTVARIAACNGCGCSGWSNTITMQYYAQCL